jgi:N-acetylmuramoyl-L-alanine amidase
MLPAAFRFLALTLALSAGAGATAADAAPRGAPSRPGSAAPAAPVSTAPVPIRKFAGVEYVSVADGAARLGLKLTWLERGRKLALTGAGARAELENDTRDITVNGLRVFLGDPILDAGGQLYVSRIDFERALTPALRAGHGVAAPGAPKTIVLDPGHGGKDNGTSVNEKTFALDVAKRAQKALEAAGYRVVLTRNADTFLELGERALIANANRGDLFVSIHFNALPNDRKTSGVEVFTFAPKHQHAAEWWSLLRKTDPHLETTDMPINRFDHWNVVLAQAIQRHFVAGLKSFDRGRKLAHWGVLRGLNCPGVLVECGFLTSEIEARKIATPAHRQKLADAIVAGIRDYAALAETPRPKSSAVAKRARTPVTTR